MRYLLDTMVVSEPARPSPNRAVIDWLEEQPVLELAISVLTIGEIARAVARMANGRRKRRLEKWLATEMPVQFEGRLLAIDAPVVQAWGELSAESEWRGRPLPVVDGLLLATALVHSLTMITRNIDDCGDRGVHVLNPYR